MYMAGMDGYGCENETRFESKLTDPVVMLDNKFNLDTLQENIWLKFITKQIRT